MCFAPKISLATALFEFLVATYILLRARASFVVTFLVIFIYLLGFYQITEFMLCVTGQAKLWGTLGFLTYNVLPALGLHFTLRCRKKRFPFFLLYIPAIIFGSVAVLNKGFIIEGTCMSIFVFVKTLYYREAGNFYITFIYWTYYFGYILISSLYLLQGFFNEKNKGWKLLYAIAIIALLLSILPAFYLLILFPSLGMIFPSIYCEFALLFSIAALVGVYVSDKYHIKNV